MIKLLNEDAFTDAVTANPTWQMINRICKDYGYNFDPYARVDVDKNGKQTLEDIRIWPDDRKNMPSVEINIKTTPFTYNITTPNGSWDGNLNDYKEFLESWGSLVTLLEELNEIDFYTLYQNIQLEG